MRKSKRYFGIIQMSFREFFTTNTWWGKLLGAFFGYLIAGSAGALIGLLLGNLFDRGLAVHLHPLHGFYLDEKKKHVQKIFLEVTFTMMGHIAKADGRVSEKEINSAKEIMKNMGLNSEQRKAAKLHFNEGKSSFCNTSLIINLLIKTCSNDPELLKLFMDIQYRAAQVDGLTGKKIIILDTIFKQMGFAPLHQQYRYQEDFVFNQNYNTSENNHQSYSRPESTTSVTLSQAFKLLEISSNATKAEVKNAYRRLISRNHPDKLIAKGASESRIKIANDKTQQITKAYELICKSKNW